MSNLPLKVGVPGADLELKPGHFVLVGWENGRPDRPYVTDWESGADDAIPLKVALRALLLELGGDGVTPVVEWALLGSTTSEVLLQLATQMGIAAAALQAASVGACAPLQAGHAALNAALQTFIDQHAASNGFKSTTVKVAY